ncbi:MAG: hypothetical protein WBD95_03800, partial [Xanthobacteraceae bacterium]
TLAMHKQVLNGGIPRYSEYAVFTFSFQTPTAAIFRRQDRRCLQAGPDIPCIRGCSFQIRSYRSGNFGFYRT